MIKNFEKFNETNELSSGNYFTIDIEKYKKDTGYYPPD